LHDNYFENECPSPDGSEIPFVTNSWIKVLQK
jgi:hypothetical protein